MAQGIAALSSTWETWTGLLPPNFGSAQSQPLQTTDRNSISASHINKALKTDKL